MVIDPITGTATDRITMAAVITPTMAAATEATMGDMVGGPMDTAMVTGAGPDVAGVVKDFMVALAEDVEPQSAHKAKLKPCKTKTQGCC